MYKRNTRDKDVPVKVTTTLGAAAASARIR